MDLLRCESSPGNPGDDWLAFADLVSEGLDEDTARRLLARFGSTTGHNREPCVEAERLGEYLALLRLEGGEA
jgi:hypothetical protein